MPISLIVEAARVPSQLLGELFVEKGLITHEELEEALAEQKVSGKRLGEVLVKKGFVSGPALTTVLAEQLGVEMETQEGFGSGLWSEIKRRHPRGRSGDDEGVQPEVEEPEPAAEPRLAAIDGLFDALFDDNGERQAGEPVADAGASDGELQSLRQQVTFAAERLDEERAAHEGTQRLLDEARAEAEAHSREADDWRERAAGAEDSGQETQAARAELAELNGVVADLRAELAAREEALQRDTEAEAARDAELARLQAELTDLRERGAATEADVSTLAKQLQDERAGHAGTQGLLDGAGIEAAELARVVADLRTELAAREEAFRRDTEAEAASDAELARIQAELPTLTKQLEDERAGHAGMQERLDEACTEASDLASVVAELRAELAARDEAFQRGTEAEAELEANLVRLQAEATDLRAGRARADDQLTALTQQLEDESAGRARTQELLAELRAELAEREEALQRDTETEAELEAELTRFQATLPTLTKQLDDERAAHAAAQRQVEDARTEAVELDEVVTRLRAELVRRDAVATEHDDQLGSLRDELAAGDAARDREADARVATEVELAQLRADALVLHQRLDDERAENVASRREVGRLESQLSEVAPVTALLDEADRELAARTDELAELTLELEHVRGLLAERAAASPVEEIVAGHILFRPGAGGYELAERPGPAPDVGTVEDVDGERFLVTRIGRSPLPADRRRCAYLEAA